MSQKTVNAIKVLSEKEINQKMAGYKASYNRKVNQAKGAERTKLENGRENYLAECMKGIVEQNKKSVQRLAGFKSWETRRANQAAVEKKPEVKKKVVVKNPRKYSSTVGVRVVSKKK